MGDYFEQLIILRIYREVALISGPMKHEVSYAYQKRPPYTNYQYRDIKQHRTRRSYL